ncbi:hypothetical protein N0V88_007524 [Collariella sp. IMI 366227]|nr:hypothetical protein N0V88_007524 [Collariella sp. IMI 366227]
MTVYVVTGTRTGIGLEYVRQISASPANTVFALVRSVTDGSDISALQLIQSTAPGKVHILPCDVSSPDSISALPFLLTTTTTTTNNPSLQIDVLLNNAAILHTRTETALTLTAPTLFSHIQTNVLGPALLLQHLLPSSLQPPAYISKTALNMLTVHQARQIREGGVEGWRRWWWFVWIRGM